MFQLVERVAGLRAEKMRGNSELKINTTIDADDAVELFQAFEQEFGVNMIGYVTGAILAAKEYENPLAG